VALRAIPIRRPGRRGPRAAQARAGVGRPSSADLVGPLFFCVRLIFSFLSFPFFFFSLVFSFYFIFFLNVQI
jgi:hypothetical protein